MKITAALCYFDEEPDTLTRCISSLAGVADELVAIDGRWEPYPDPLTISPLEQTLHVAAAARNAGLLIWRVVPDQPWPSQMAKRTHSLQTATARLATWILVIDADEYIAYANVTELRNALAATDLDAADVTIRNVTGHDFPGIDQPRRRLLRAHPDLEVRDWHNDYRIGDRRLAGPPRETLEPGLNLKAELQIEHTPGQRPADREARDRAYRHARAARDEQ